MWRSLIAELLRALADCIAPPRMPRHLGDLSPVDIDILDRAHAKKGR